MSPIALGMDLVLAVLLISALGFGLRLERRLKALREGQERFAGAVAELDRAARRAETGLAELRAATEEAVDLLGGRIEKARELAARLERFTSESARPVAAARAAAPEPQRTARAPLERAPIAPRTAERAGPRADRRDEPLSTAGAEAAAQDLVLRLTETQMLSRDRGGERLAADRPTRAEPLRAARPARASIDDDLFEAPPRASAGARR